MNKSRKLVILAISICLAVAVGIVAISHPAHACQVAGGMGGMTPCHA